MKKFHEDSLGNRMKFYERLVSDQRLMPLVPVCCRIDGFCKGLKRPFDERLSNLMAETTKHLVTQSGAKLGYTQSDEISLIWYSEDWKSQIYFDGRVHKMTTSLASMASVFFNLQLPNFLPEKVGKMPTFDARVFVVPTLEEAANYILWREQDATKNSISMAAQSQFSHKALQHKNGSEMQEMLFQNGTNWNNYPNFFKRGTYFKKSLVKIPFTVDEIEKLPANHAARKNPNLIVERQVISKLDIPPLGTISNRVGVLFGNEPVQHKTQ